MTLRKIANGEPYTIPPTIDDPTSLTEMEALLKTVGYPKKHDFGDTVANNLSD